MSTQTKHSGIEWIGDIPVSWDTIKLKFYGKIYNGSTPKSDKPEYYNGDITWVTPADMDNASIITSSKKTISQTGLESCGTNLVPKNSIVISTRAPIGVICIAGTELCTNQGCKSIVPKDISCAKYPYYFLLTQSDVLNMLGKGTTFLELSTSDLSNYKIPFPAQQEQQAIADYLDGECARIDGIVSTQRQIIERLKEYKKSVITEAVTRGLNPDVPMKDSGIEWIGKIPEHWEISKVSFFFDIQLGKMVQPNKENEFDIERPYLCAVNFGNNTFKLDTIKTMWFSPAEIELYRVSVGDLFVVEGGDIASSDFVTHPLEDFGFQNALHRVRARASADTRFLRYLLIVAKNTGYIDLICNKATIAHFSKDKFQNMPFLVAPLSEQQAIADYLDRKCGKIDNIIEKRERMIELMTEYKKSLIYECVTGKKEIVDVVE